MNFDKYQNKLPYPCDTASRNAYREESARLISLFRSDAIAFTGLAGHPRADKAFSLAWERGHANGFSEVFSELQDLAELLLD